MDTRRLVPAGTAVIALLVLLPLGYQLYSTTMLTPSLQQYPEPAPASAPEPAKPAAPVARTSATVPAKSPTVSPTENAVAPSADKPAPMSIETASGSPASPPVATTPPLAGKPVATLPPAAPEPVLAAEQASASMSMGTAHNAARAAASANAPVVPAGIVGGLAAAPPPPDAAARPLRPVSRPEPAALVDALSADAAVSDSYAATPAYAPSPIASGGYAKLAAPSGDTFQAFTEGQQKAVSTDPVSTFSIDVDTASYSYMRRALNEGRIPEPDAVRLEELINYFPYDYPAATDASHPFKPTVSVFPTPWNKATEIMAIGIKGYEPPVSARKPSNLVFLVDTSGSMDEPDKLPLLQKALGLLVNTLSPNDTVSIVTYAGSAGVVLEPTEASNKVKILSALDNLEAGGSTAGAAGIELAYQLAARHKLADGNNRVILATDGDFNVGISDPDALKKFIKGKRQSGIGLSVLGFGEGNLDDATMQALAQNGDGNASYIDSLLEAQKVLVREAGSTLDTIAKDVKIQVEFNPAAVSSYRLIGYETRALNREDFNNDQVDAGDVGAGHTVTALYEITPTGSDAAPVVDPLRYGAAPTMSAATAAGAGKSSELADLKLRYKLPGSDTSQLIEQPVTPVAVVSDIAKASNDARWAAAVAAFGQKLKGSDYGQAITYGDIAAIANGARGADPEGYRAEFVRLVGLAQALDTKPETNQRPASKPLGKPLVN